MELLYVWIENFRNIKNKGFNFSKEYEINYESVDNEIKVKTIEGEEAVIIEDSVLRFIDNENYLNDFFPEKLVNVTAILGKNSTGKSNVLDFILTTLQTGKRGRIGESKYLLLFKDKGLLSFFGKPNTGSLKTATLKWQGNEVLKLDPNDRWTSLFYSNVADQREYIFNGNSVYNFSHNEINKSQANKIGFASSNEFEVTRKNIIPETDSEQVIRFVFEPIAYEKLKKKKVNDTIKGIFERYNKAIYKESTSNFNRFKYGLTLSLFCYLYSKENVLENRIKSVNMADDEIAEPISTLNPKLIEFIKNFKLEEKDDNFSRSDLDLFIQLIHKLENPIDKKISFGKVEKNSPLIIIEFDDIFVEFIAEMRDVFNKTEIITHDWSMLSSGMKAYLSLYSQLFSIKNYVNDNSEKSLLICIDEGELYMHPEWQRRFLSDLIEFLTNNFESDKIQVILTSHSPFLISDLPKESVILLEESGTPNRQLKEKSSFGANIHQLFTKQFFLSDGTMGAFAQIKIKKLYNRIDSISPKDLQKIEALIEMVGEPILRYRLKEKLKKKVATFPNKDQIDWHLNQIKKIKRES
jgi:predicted ATP-binding protein involved in virulence